MFAVPCPQVRGGRGQRLVTERSIRSMAAVPHGWLLTIACPCGQEHALQVPRLAAQRG